MQDETSYKQTDQATDVPAYWAEINNVASNKHTSASSISEHHHDDGDELFSLSPGSSAEQQKDGTVPEPAPPPAVKRNSTITWDVKSPARQTYARFASIREPEDLRSNEKANKYAGKIARSKDKLFVEREKSQVLYSDLSYQQEKSRTTKEYFVESVDDVVTALEDVARRLECLQPDSPLAPEMKNLREKYKLVRDDYRELGEQDKALKASEQKYAIAEKAVADQHGQIFEYVDIFLANVEWSPNDDDRSSAGSSHASETVAQPNKDRPPVLTTYLHKLGDRRIMYERVTEIEFEHQEELSRRELLRDQDQPIDEKKAQKIDQEYDDELAIAKSDLTEAEEALALARTACYDEGVDPDTYKEPSLPDDDHPSFVGQPTERREVISHPRSPPLDRFSANIPLISGDGSQDLLLAREEMSIGVPSISSPQPLSSAPSDRVHKWIFGIENAELPEPADTPAEDAVTPLELESRLTSREANVPSEPGETHSDGLSLEKDFSLPVNGVRESEAHMIREIGAQHGLIPNEPISKSHTPSISNRTGLQVPLLVIPPDISTSEPSPSRTRENDFDEVSVKPRSPSSVTDLSSQPKTIGSYSQCSPINARPFWPQPDPHAPDSNLLTAPLSTSPYRNRGSGEPRARTPTSSDTLHAHDDSTDMYSKIGFSPISHSAWNPSTIRRMDRWLLENGDRLGKHSEYQDFSQRQEDFRIGTVFETFIVSLLPSSDKALSNFTTTPAFENTHTKVGRFVILRLLGNDSPAPQAQRGFVALAIKTYGGHGVGESGVIKAYHAPVHTTDELPKIGPEEEPRRLENDCMETGMIDIPFHVLPHDPSCKLDPMSRIDFSDSMYFTYRITAKIIGQLDRNMVVELRRQHIFVEDDIASTEDAAPTHLESRVWPGRRSSGRAIGRSEQKHAVATLTRKQHRKFAEIPDHFGDATDAYLDLRRARSTTM